MSITLSISRIIALNSINCCSSIERLNNCRFISTVLLLAARFNLTVKPVPTGYFFYHHLKEEKKNEENFLNGWAVLSFVIAGRSWKNCALQTENHLGKMRKGHIVYFVTRGMIDSVKTQKSKLVKITTTTKKKKQKEETETKTKQNDNPRNHFISKTDEFSDGH